jgi:tRNA (guanine37-N1)-methyltransferase
MKISVLTLFPEALNYVRHSILGNAINNNKIEFEAINIRDYSADKHAKCDDYAFGGGSGMVMTPQPIYDCITAVDPEHRAHRIYMSPKGKTLSQKIVTELATRKYLLLLCGHYEGVDQRALDMLIDEEISIGDYVLTGGEAAALVLIDGVARYLPGVLGNAQSTEEESFSDGLLEYPQYTRPQSFMGAEVPEVLISGHHENVAKWRKEQALKITRENRPDLYRKYSARIKKGASCGLDINKLHTTELGGERIKLNLGLTADDVVGWCKRAVLDAGADSVIRKGKNWYVYGNGYVLTINADSHTVITAHRS